MRPLYHNIWLLLRARYPRFTTNIEPISIEDLKEHFENCADNLSLLEDEEIGEFRSAEHHLSLLMDTDNTELNDIANDMLNETAAKHPFNQNSYLANDETYQHWLQCEYFTIQEAAALSVGRNPEKINEILNENDLGLDAIQLKIKKAIRILDRLKSVQEGDGHISKIDFIEWIKSSDSERGAAILKFSPEKSLLSTKTKEHTSNSGETKERNTMLKLIIGMAIAKYNHDPKTSRNSTVTNIRNSLIGKNIKISDDTIRKYLEEAKEVLPDIF